ncbi:MAG: hypothetical protein ABIY52_05105, partial [Gemmatimonadaceae bacterium]
GMTLPEHQKTVKQARIVFDPGQIFDFQFAPRTAGAMTLRFGLPAFLGPPPGYKQTEVPIIIR